MHDYFCKWDRYSRGCSIFISCEMRSYVLAFCNLEIEHRASINRSSFCHLFDFAILSMVKLICEEFYPLASNFVCWVSQSFLFVFVRPPKTTTEFWLFIIMKLLQLYSSNLSNYGCRDIFTPTGSVTMCGPLSYKMLCSRARNARRLLTALRLWHVTQSCSPSEKTADWENFLSVTYLHFYN